ncbi:MAG: general secretion pathway protein GspH [Symploca sp. SIO2C1]|nr:general secretion pathway protein GspH [Symploca sp. SIO2C1]
MTGNSHEQVSSSPNSGCGCLLSLIVLGLLGLIFVPSFLSTTHSHGQSEAKTYVGSIIRGQQAYFLEKNTFANTIEPLGLGIKTQTENYTYSTRATDKSAFIYGIPLSDKYIYKKKYFGLFSKKVKGKLDSYIGAVFIIPATEVSPNGAADELAIISILCKATVPGTSKLAEPTYIDGKLACSEGTSELE